MLWSTAGLALPVPSTHADKAAPYHQLDHVRLVVLDPGHGGSNRGCLGVNGTWEKVATLELAQLVSRMLLEETSAAVMMTRQGDEDLGLRARTEMANAWGADLFLSLHFNADEWGRGHGVETWFLDTEAADAAAQKIVASEEAAYQETIADHHEVPTHGLQRVLHEATVRKAQIDSEALAAELLGGLRRATGAPSRGVRQAAFGVLKAARMPAVVVEGGFMSHTVEGMKIRDRSYLEKIARGIVAGIIAWDRRVGGQQARRLGHRGAPGR